MLLYTAQPKERRRGRLSMADRLGLSDHLGHQPLFCTPIDPSSLGEFWFRAWSAAPRRPEEILLIDAPDGLPVPMDVIAWTQMMARDASGRHDPRHADWNSVLREGDPIATDWLLPPSCDGCSVRAIDIWTMGDDPSWAGGEGAGGRLTQRRAETLMGACRNAIRDGQVAIGGRRQDEVTCGSLYGTMTMSATMAILWELATGGHVAPPVFQMTPQRMARRSAALAVAQRRLAGWDLSLDWGRAKDIRFLRRLHDGFLRGLVQVAQSVADESVRISGRGRGTPCPCGSGIPYPRCHGRMSSIDELIVTRGVTP